MGKRSERLEAVLIASVSAVAIVAICFMFFSYLLWISGEPVFADAASTDDSGSLTGAVVGEQAQEPISVGGTPIPSAESDVEPVAIRFG